MTSLVDRFLRSKVGKEFEQQDAAELLERRRFLVGEIARLTSEHEAELPALVKAEEQALTKVRASEDTLRAIQATHNAASLARVTRANHYDSQVGPLEGELRASASPLIDGFLEECRGLYEQVRRQESVSPNLRPNASFPHPDDVKAANARNEAQVARLARIRQARDAAPGLKLLALTPAELDARLAELRQTTTAEGK